MNDNDQKFEEYLRGFEPVRPRPLPLAARASYGPRRIAAAAVAAVLIGIWSWLAAGRDARSVQGPAAEEPLGNTAELAAGTSAASLTRIALDDKNELDVRIDEVAAQVLPCCRGAHSSLSALAKQ
jgi:hypothetical protein